MSFDYLEALEQAVDSGQVLYACPGGTQNRWHIVNNPKDLRVQAQRFADSRATEVSIYRLINKSEALATDSFLICRKILEPGPTGEPKLEWALVDTKEAAEMMRDVSQGPSPFFGATLFETCKPTK